MSSFVRFILTVLIVGIVVNLAIVLLANARSQSRQMREMAADRDRFSTLLENINGRLRRADLVVESQRVDAKGDALESTLLCRQYISTSSDQSRPLPVVRLSIPGNRLCMEGLVLDFGPSFAEDAPDFRLFRGNRLAYFGLIYGEGETAPPPNKGPDTRFSFVQKWSVPDLTRLDAQTPQPTYFEQRLWQYVWDLVKEPTAVIKGNPTTDAHGVTATWTKPATQAVRLQHIYSAFIAPDMDRSSPISIEEDSPNSVPGLLDAMLAEGKALTESAEPDDGQN